MSCVFLLQTVRFGVEFAVGRLNNTVLGGRLARDNWTPACSASAKMLNPVFHIKHMRRLVGGIL